jgi:ATP-dependent RNA helicase HelY
VTDISSQSIDTYLSSVPFAPDPFQRRALDAIENGRSVVVTAPTGAGKTLIAEGAIAAALGMGRRAFYTTPIKALSNQKFADLRTWLGNDNVGLLTGDNVVNGDAPVVVMTTEVLRNMIYDSSPALDDLETVILDEVHYLADRSRGSVWEEVIIHLPQQTSLVCLSATIANPEEFTNWIIARRGETDLIIETIRPVPLETMYMWRDRHAGGSTVMLPMFGRNGRPNDTISKLTRSSRNRHARLGTPRRTAVIEHLADEHLLPAIYFVFSRNGCDQTAQHVAQSSLRLTTSDERDQIRRVVERRTAHLAPQDLAVLGYSAWLSVLERGAASHHAGLIPTFKETVEELFLSGLVKVVAATETLAVGINMPARTVVLESLSKFTGEGHELLQPSDFTQLTGRAGRRGIDTAGTAVVLYSPHVPFDRASGIAGAGANPLRSSFAPTYNMAVNLMARYDVSEAHELLRASFANFSTSGRRKQLTQNLEDRRKDITTFRDAAECDRGDIWAFYDGSSRPSVPEMERQLLQPGAVIEFAAASHVLVNRSWGGGHPKMVLVDGEGRKLSIKYNDFPRSAFVVGNVTLPTPIRSSDDVYRREVADMLERFIPEDDPVPVFVSSDPDGVGGCPDLETHIGWADRAIRATRDADRLVRRLERSERNDVVDTFENIHSVLDALGYTSGWELSDRGTSLRKLYNELDLLLAESIRRKVFDGLTPEEFAAAASLFTFETRGAEDPAIPRLAFATSIIEVVDGIRESVVAVERANGADEQRIPDPGLMEIIHGWGLGHDLEEIFDTDDIRAGDFVRSARQLLDLLRQIRDGFDVYRSVASEAIACIDRGIVQVGGFE